MLPATTQVKEVSPDDVFKSDIAKDKWPSGPTKTVGTEPDAMLSLMRSGYGTLKGTITKCKQQVFKNRFSKDTLNTLNVKLKDSLEGMQELWKQMANMHQLPTADKNKVHEDYHIYEKLVTDAQY